MFKIPDVHPNLERQSHLQPRQNEFLQDNYDENHEHLDVNNPLREDPVLPPEPMDFFKELLRKMIMVNRNHNSSVNIPAVTPTTTTTTAADDEDAIPSTDTPILTSENTLIYDTRSYTNRDDEKQENVSLLEEEDTRWTTFQNEIKETKLTQSSIKDEEESFEEGVWCVECREYYYQEERLQEEAEEEEDDYYHEEFCDQKEYTLEEEENHPQISIFPFGMKRSRIEDERPWNHEKSASTYHDHHHYSNNFDNKGNINNKNSNKNNNKKKRKRSKKKNNPNSYISPYDLDPTAYRDFDTEAVSQNYQIVHTQSTLFYANEKSVRDGSEGIRIQKNGRLHGTKNMNDGQDEDEYERLLREAMQI